MSLGLSGKTTVEYSITHWYQPIIELGSKIVFGYEALLRGLPPHSYSPLEIFKRADKMGERTILDRQSLAIACNRLEPGEYTLFLNVFPSTLLEKNFIEWWDRYVFPPVPLVLELSESETVRDWESLKEVVKELRERQVKIAIDDMGAGHSSFRQWIELEPDFIKVDGYFAADLAGNRQKQKVIESLVKLFQGTTQLVIEGIERRDDLEMAQHLGVSYAQGYFLGKPAAWDNLKHISPECRADKNNQVENKKLANQKGISNF